MWGVWWFIPPKTWKPSLYSLSITICEIGDEYHHTYKWGMDIIIPFNTNGQYKFLLIGINYFTKWILWRRSTECMSLNSVVMYLFINSFITSSIYSSDLLYLLLITYLIYLHEVLISGTSIWFVRPLHLELNFKFEVIHITHIFFFFLKWISPWVTLILLTFIFKVIRVTMRFSCSVI